MPFANEPAASQATKKFLFGYSAGKARLAPDLVPLIPAHKTYVEPFVGSASVFLAKPDRSVVEVLNDIDKELIEALRLIAKLSDDDIEKLSKFDWLSSLKTHTKLRASKPTDKLQKIHRFLYLTRFSRRRDRKAKFDPTHTGRNSQNVTRIKRHREQLKRAKIFSGDYRKVIERFDAPDTFFFLDPPYVGTVGNVGEKDFDEEAFEKVLRSIKGKFLVTYGVKGKLNTKGFHVRRIMDSKGRNFTSQKDSGGIPTLLISNYTLSKSLSMTEEIYLDESVAIELAETSAIATATAQRLSTFVSKCARYSQGGSVRELAKALEPVEALGVFLAGFGDAPVVDVPSHPEHVVLALSATLKAFSSASLPQLIKEQVDDADAGLAQFLAALHVLGELDHGDPPASVGKLAIAEINADLLGKLGDDDLNTAHEQIHQLFAGNFADNEKAFTGGMRRFDLIEAELVVQAEMNRRGMSHDADDTLTKEARHIEQRKGGEPQGGAHWHKLDRKSKTTDESGAHRHIFKLPDGSFIATERDGAHSHKIASTTADKTAKDGKHTHKLKLPDGSVVDTGAGVSAHEHELQVAGTVFDGLHPHTLKMDGKTILSLTPGQFFEAATKGDLDTSAFPSVPGQGGSFRNLPAGLTQPDDEDEDDKIKKRELSTGDRNDFPDSSFLYIRSGGDKDGDGKTVPRTLRMFPVRDGNGEILLPQLRNALARIPQADIPQAVKDRLASQARRMLDDATKRARAFKVCDPCFDLPEHETKHGAVVQYHFHAKSMHVDFRVRIDDHLIGWTIHTQRDGTLRDAVDTIKSGEAIAKSFGIDGDRFVRSLREPGSVVATRKLRHSVEWLHADAVFDECEPGATMTHKGVIVEVARPVVELGVQIDDLHEYFLTGDTCGSLVMRKNDEQWSASIAASNLPYVLREGATLPLHNRSALPESLRKDVPYEFRFWNERGDKAVQMHAALIKSQIFTPDSVRLVSGELRRVVYKAFLAKISDDPIAPTPWTERVEQSIDGGLKVVETFGALRKQHNAIAYYDAGCNGIDGVVAAALGMDGAYVITAKDSPRARDAMSRAGEVFKYIPDRSTALDAIERLFVASSPLARTTGVEFIHHKIHVPKPVFDLDVIKDPVVKALLGREIPLLKTEDERFVLGIVLEPEVRDAQGDIYSEAEVREAAHAFMEQFQNIGFMHRELINDKVSILESYVSPAAFTISGEQVKKGTWLFATRINDSAMWDAIKRGDLGGYSIGGSAVRVPESSQN